MNPPMLEELYETTPKQTIVFTVSFLDRHRETPKTLIYRVDGLDYMGTHGPCERTYQVKRSISLSTYLRCQQEHAFRYRHKSYGHHMLVVDHWLFRSAKV